MMHESAVLMRVGLAALGVLLFTACAAGSVDGMTTGGQVPVDSTTIPANGSSNLVTPAADLGSPMEVQSGQVMITLSKTEFKSGEKIAVTILNGLDRTIYSDDMKSACSIVYLEQQAGGTWTPVLGCGMERMSFTIAIGPGMGWVIEIDPLSGFAAGAMPGIPGFGPGTYRIRFTYRFDPEQDGNEPISSISDAITVNR